MPKEPFLARLEQDGVAIARGMGSPCHSCRLMSRSCKTSSTNLHSHRTTRSGHARVDSSMSPRAGNTA
jgi:hypothetical protein